MLQQQQQQQQMQQLLLPSPSPLPRKRVVPLSVLAKWEYDASKQAGWMHRGRKIGGATPVVWYLVLQRAVDFTRPALLLNLLSVCKDMFSLVQTQCVQLLYFLSLRMPSARTLNEGRKSHSGALIFDTLTHLPRLIERMGCDEEAMTRENMSFLLAALIAVPRPPKIRPDYKGRWSGDEPLKHLYRHQPQNQVPLRLYRDAAVQVYDLPAENGTTLEQRRPLNEAERFALSHARGAQGHAMFFAVMREHLVLRKPLPGDPLRRVVLNGEHIFSEHRQDELWALFSYAGKRNSVMRDRFRDVVCANATRREYPNPFRARRSSGGKASVIVLSDSDDDEEGTEMMQVEEVVLADDDTTMESDMLSSETLGEEDTSDDESVSRDLLNDDDSSTAETSLYEGDDDDDDDDDDDSGDDDSEGYSGGGGREDDEEPDF